MNPNPTLKVLGGLGFILALNNEWTLPIIIDLNLFKMKLPIQNCKS
jgi:hypothetical protein